MNPLGPSVGLVWVTEHLAGLIIEKRVFLIFFSCGASWEASCVKVEVNSRGKNPNGSLAVRGATMVLEKKPVA